MNPNPAGPDRIEQMAASAMVVRRNVLEGTLQRAERERFTEQWHAEGLRTPSILDRVGTRHGDAAEHRLLFDASGHQLPPIHVRHEDIGNQDVEGFGAHLRERLGSMRRDRHVIADAAEDVGEEIAQCRVILHDQHARATGPVTVADA